MENGLSDHDVQILVQKELHILFQKIIHKNKTRQINIETIAKFQLLLRENVWNPVCNTDNINSMFNSFHCIF
jgi:hypothetical protein